MKIRSSPRHRGCRHTLNSGYGGQNLPQSKYQFEDWLVDGLPCKCLLPKDNPEKLAERLCREDPSRNYTKEVANDIRVAFEFVQNLFKEGCEELLTDLKKSLEEYFNNFYMLPGCNSLMLSNGLCILPFQAIQPTLSHFTNPSQIKQFFDGLSTLLRTLKEKGVTVTAFSSFVHQLNNITHSLQGQLTPGDIVGIVSLTNRAIMRHRALQSASGWDSFLQFIFFLKTSHDTEQSDATEDDIHADMAMNFYKFLTKLEEKVDLTDYSFKSFPTSPAAIELGENLLEDLEPEITYEIVDTLSIIWEYAGERYANSDDCSLNRVEHITFEQIKEYATEFHKRILKPGYNPTKLYTIRVLVELLNSIYDAFGEIFQRVNPEVIFLKALAQLNQHAFEFIWREFIDKNPSPRVPSESQSSFETSRLFLDCFWPSVEEMMVKDQPFEQTVVHLRQHLETLWHQYDPTLRLW